MTDRYEVTHAEKQGSMTMAGNVEDMWVLHILKTGETVPHGVVFPHETLDWRKAVWEMDDGDDREALQMILEEVFEPGQFGPSKDCDECQKAPQLWRYCYSCKKNLRRVSRETAVITDPNGHLSKILDEPARPGALAEKRKQIRAARRGKHAGETNV